MANLSDIDLEMSKIDDAINRIEKELGTLADKSFAKGELKQVFLTKLRSIEKMRAARQSSPDGIRHPEDFDYTKIINAPLHDTMPECRLLGSERLWENYFHRIETRLETLRRKRAVLLTNRSRILDSSTTEHNDTKELHQFVATRMKAWQEEQSAISLERRKAAAAERARLQVQAEFESKKAPPEPVTDTAFDQPKYATWIEVEIRLYAGNRIQHTDPTGKKHWYRMTDLHHLVNKQTGVFSKPGVFY